MPVPTAEQWKKYDTKTRQAWLAKMTPDDKAKLRAALKPAASAPAAADIHNPDRYAQPVPLARQVIDATLDQLPTVGGVAGGAVGAGSGAVSGPGDIATTVGGAALGGAAGEDIRELLGKHIYSDPAKREELKNPPVKKVLSDVANEGATQGIAEATGQGMNAMGEKLLEKIGLKGAAHSAAMARAGNGVQKTPGEVSGNRAQQMLEHFLSYMPGAMGPMGRFEERRAGQTAATLEKELDQIATKKLTREQSGDAISKVIDTMHANAKAEAKLAEDTAVAEANRAYNPLKKPLGLPDDATRDQVEKAAQAAAKPRPSGVLDASGRPVMTPGDGGRALRDLKAADIAYGAAKKKAEGATAAAEAKIEADIVTKLARTNRTEAMHTMIAKSSMKDLRELMPRLDPETRAAVGRNVLEDVLHTGQDPVSGAFDARAALKAMDTLDRDGQRTAVLFGKNANTVRESLKEIAAIQRHSPGGGMAGHRVFSTLLAALPAASVGLVTGNMPITLALVGGEMGASRMLAELVTNPETSMATLTGLRRLAAGTVRIGAPMALAAARQPDYASGNLIGSNGQVTMPAAAQ